MLETVPRSALQKEVQQLGPAGETWNGGVKVMKRDIDYPISDPEMRQMNVALDHHIEKLECSLIQARKESEKSGCFTFSVNIFSGSAETFLRLMESHELAMPEELDTGISAHESGESREI